MSTLEHAIALAAEAHAGDTDRAGNPYIHHPMRVMYACEEGTEARTVAALHDVVENTDWTLDGLRAEGFGEEIVAAVDAVSRRDDEEYLDYVARCAQDSLGRVVKRADLRDNMGNALDAEPGPEDYHRVVRYVRALAVLDGVSLDEVRGW